MQLSSLWGLWTVYQSCPFPHRPLLSFGSEGRSSKQVHATRTHRTPPPRLASSWGARLTTRERFSKGCSSPGLLFGWWIGTFFLSSAIALTFLCFSNCGSTGVNVHLCRHQEGGYLRSCCTKTPPSPLSLSNPSSWDLGTATFPSTAPLLPASSFVLASFKLHWSNLKQRSGCRRRWSFNFASSVNATGAVVRKEISSSAEMPGASILVSNVLSASPFSSIVSSRAVEPFPLVPAVLFLPYPSPADLSGCRSFSLFSCKNCCRSSGLHQQERAVVQFLAAYFLMSADLVWSPPLATSRPHLSPQTCEAGVTPQTLSGTWPFGENMATSANEFPSSGGLVLLLRDWRAQPTSVLPTDFCAVQGVCCLTGRGERFCNLLDCLDNGFIELGLRGGPFFLGDSQNRCPAPGVTVKGLQALLLGGTCQKENALESRPVIRKIRDVWTASLAAASSFSWNSANLVSIFWTSRDLRSRSRTLLELAILQHAFDA